jgi:hypothetical protein
VIIIFFVEHLLANVRVLRSNGALCSSVYCVSLSVHYSVLVEDCTLCRVKRDCLTGSLFPQSILLPFFHRTVQRGIQDDRLRQLTSRTLELVRIIDFRHRKSMEHADPPSASECVSGDQPFYCRQACQEGKRSRLLPMFECPDIKDSYMGSASGMDL